MSDKKRESAAAAAMPHTERQGEKEAGEKKESILIRGIRKTGLIPEKTLDSAIEAFGKCRAGLSAILYAVMVFVVIYGMSQNVYAGFPTLVPYLIIAVFLFMAFVRMYQSLVSGVPARTKDKKKK